jgi:uncharacterized protein
VDTVQKKLPFLFFVLVLASSLPIWVIGVWFRLELLPGVPIAGLTFVCPAIAALVLRYQEGGIAGMRGLLARAFDYQRIGSHFWIAPILLIAPGTFALSLWIMRCLGVQLPAPEITFLPTLSLCGIFLVAASGEELGWTGYAIDPLQRRWGVLGASLLVGSVWAVWHFVALAELGRSPVWIAWWSLWTVAARVIMVWLYNRTGGSVLGVTLYHASSNVCWQLFPIHGSYFDPRLTGLITVAVAVIIFVSTAALGSSHPRCASGSQ